MTVTAIRQSSPGRLIVSFDNGEELRSTLGAVTELRLYSGRELNEADFESFRSLSARFLAREKALELISRRPMSRKELIDKLLSKGETEDAAEYCAGWLEENGFIDEERYADQIARHYAAKGYGAGRVRAELSRRGLKRELWDEAMAAMPAVDEKLDRFIASRLKNPEDRDEIRKVSSALYRRGYSWEEIRSALARYNAAEED